jgi:hypothetical protein
MPNKSTPPKSAYGPTRGGKSNTGSATKTGLVTDPASTQGKAVASAKKFQSPKRLNPGRK